MLAGKVSDQGLGLRGVFPVGGLGFVGGLCSALNMEGRLVLGSNGAWGTVPLHPPKP